MLCFAHWGQFSLIPWLVTNSLPFLFFTVYLWQQLKKRVWISRNRNEVEGQGIKINNTSNLRRRELYLTHNSKGIVYPSREGMVARGTQSLAVGAYGITCLHLGRLQSRQSPVQARLGYSSQDPSSSLSFPLARLHLKKHHIKN